MLLNKTRKTPHDCPDDRGSLCPDCEGQLVGKRGEIMSWHWAHKSLSDCQGGGYESAWHLRMKEYCLAWEGWQVEYPVTLKNHRLRLDAHRPDSLETIEFVHSLNVFYEVKHALLMESGHKILWVADGAEFVAAHSRYLLNGEPRIYNLLKPAAFLLHQKVGLVVQYDGIFWKRDPNQDTDGHPCLRTLVEHTPTGDRVREVVDLWRPATSPTLKRFVEAINA